jgi:anti-sigma B factor antagonist
MIHAELELEAQRGDPDIGIVEAGELTICLAPNGDSCLIRLFGALDMGSAPALEREVMRAEEDHAGMIILDLSRLDFVDTSGIAVFLHAARRAREKGSQLRLLRGPRRIEHVLEIAGLTEHLQFLD